MPDEHQRLAHDRMASRDPMRGQIVMEVLWRLCAGGRADDVGQPALAPDAVLMRRARDLKAPMERDVSHHAQAMGQFCVCHPWRGRGCLRSNDFG